MPALVSIKNSISALFLYEKSEGGGFEPPVALACHIGLANRRTKPGYATPP